MPAQHGLSISYFTHPRHCFSMRAVKGYVVQLLFDITVPIALNLPSREFFKESVVLTYRDYRIIGNL